MSKYTTELRYICETKSGFPLESMDSHSPDEIITASRTAIFNFSYPIYEETHKPELEKKILKHYYTQEICAETYGLWHLWLNARMNEIMPMYNKLSRMEALTLQKELANVDIQHNTTREDGFTRTDSHTRTDNLTQTEQGSHGTTDKFSDTPQGTVSNVDNGTYLTEYRKIDETNGNTTTNTGTQVNAGSLNHTGSEDVDGWEKGYRGSKTYAELLSDYSEKVLNIDMMIINDLKNLFFMLW